MSYPMNEIYKSLKKHKDIRVEVDREDNKIITIYGDLRSKKVKDLLGQLGDSIPCFTINMREDEFEVHWGSIYINRDSDTLENYEEVIEGLKENFILPKEV